MKCNKCGYDNEQGTKFCASCGNKLEVNEVVETPIVNDVVETPVIEQPMVESPIVEQPVVDVPVGDTPVVEQPVVEQPVTSDVSEQFKKKKSLLWLWILIGVLIFIGACVYVMRDTIFGTSDDTKEEEEIEVSFLDDSSWILGDNSRMIFDGSEFLWYQVEDDMSSNYYEGVYEFYRAEEAYEYVTNDLEDYGITEEDLDGLFDRSSDEEVVLKNFILLIIETNSVFIDGIKDEFDEPNYIYYYGFILSGDTYLDVANIDTGSYTDFTLDKDFNYEEALVAKSYVNENSSLVSGAMDEVHLFDFDHDKLYSNNAILTNELTTNELIAYALNKYYHEDLAQPMTHEVFDDIEEEMKHWTFITLDEMNEYLDESGYIEQSLTEADLDNYFEEVSKEQYYYGFGRIAVDDNNNAIGLYEVDDEGRYRTTEIPDSNTGPVDKFIFKEITKAEKDSERLYIYERVAFAVFEGMSDDQSMVYYDFYKDYNNNELISSKVPYTSNLEIDAELDTYLYTFINIDGNYFLESIELAS